MRIFFAIDTTRRRLEFINFSFILGSEVCLYVLNSIFSSPSSNNGISFS